jgi:pimeloyl-ACP methyl ester carboxylesterase
LAERRPSAELVTTNVAVDVSDLVARPGTYTVEGWIRSSTSCEATGPPIALFCLPGGKCSTGYFDLQVEGFADYSMADYLARRGFIVIAFDHLGVGRSSAVDDIFRVTPELAGAANDRAHRTVLAGLEAGTAVSGLGPLPELRAIGVGHSMGGMLLGVQQARYATFVAVAILGHGVGLPSVLTDEELRVVAAGATTEDVVVELARTRFSGPAVPGGAKPPPGSFLPRDLPDEVRSAFMAQQADLLFSCGLTSMLPGATDAAKEAIAVPVFLGFGDDDLTSDFVGCVALYKAARDITLFVLPESAHCHNQSAHRTVLWDRMAHWATGVAPEGSVSRLGAGAGGPPSPCH